MGFFQRLFLFFIPIIIRGHVSMFVTAQLESPFLRFFVDHNSFTQLYLSGINYLDCVLVVFLFLRPLLCFCQTSFSSQRQVTFTY